MKFSYNNLKIAEQSGNRIGNWHGLPVLASSKYGLKNKGSGVYYIVYDDNNKIVRYKDNDWYEYGIVVNEAGTVMKVMENAEKREASSAKKYLSKKKG